MRLFTVSLLMLCLACLLPVFDLLAASDSRRIAPSTASRTAGEKRIALVIGNSAYRDKPLKNPVNDARLIGRAVKEAGFELYGGKVHEDLGYSRMMETIEGFGSALSAGGVAMVFYAGHGMQSGGSNYLIPVDASIKAENELSYKTVNAGLILAKMEQARSRVNIVVLDACRDNPFARSFRSSSGGLAAMTAPAGTLVAYSTGPGSVAEDGTGTNSIYSESLSKALKQKGITIEEAFKQVRSQVRKKTGSRQTPWENTSLEGNFIFIETSGPVTVQHTSPSAHHTADAEKEAWELIKNSSDPEDFQDFLEKFPAGVFVNTAKIKLRQLEKKRPAAASQATPAVNPAATSTLKPLTDPTTGMEFVPVKGGCFQMGDTFGDGQADEKPVHEVCVGNFSIGTYEVTKGQFRRFVDASGYRTEAETGGGCFVWNGSTWDKNAAYNWKNTGFAQDDSHPVACVTWNDSVAFARWLSEKSGTSYRLPTEAEWEYAARSGGRQEKYSGSSDINAVAWYHANSGSQTHPVGLKAANGLGIYDMSGNVWEWTADWYGEKYYASSPRNNPQGPSTGQYRVLRGGSWYDRPEYVRAAARLRYEPTLRTAGYGFRLAVSAQ